MIILPEKSYSVTVAVDDLTFEPDDAALETFIADAIARALDETMNTTDEVQKETT